MNNIDERAESAKEIALANHDRDFAERQLAKVAAENMRLREEIERLKRVVEQIRTHVAARGTIIEICDKAIAATKKED